MLVLLSAPGTGKSQRTDITGQVRSDDQVDLVAT